MLQTQVQKEEQNSSQTNVNEMNNSAYGEDTEVIQRYQYRDSPIWIIERNKETIAIICDSVIARADKREDIEIALGNMPPNLLCTIIAIMAEKIAQFVKNDINQ